MSEHINQQHRTLLAPDADLEDAQSEVEGCSADTDESMRDAVVSVGMDDFI